MQALEGTDLYRQCGQGTRPTELDLFQVAPGSTPSLCLQVYSQLVCILPVEILNLSSLLDLFGCFKMISVRCQQTSRVFKQYRVFGF